MINYLPHTANWFTSDPAYSVSQSMLISSLGLKGGTAKGQERISIAGSCFFHIPLLWNLLCTVTERPVNAMQSYPSLRAVLLPNLTSAFSVSSTFWPLMSLWMTLCWWRWVSPCKRHKYELGEKKGQVNGKMLNSQIRLWMGS